MGQERDAGEVRVLEISVFMKRHKESFRALSSFYHNISPFQFHGSEGKAAALASKTSSRSADALSPHDNGDTRLCWRADGQHFAISFIQGKTHPGGGDAPEGFKRLIRVFARLENKYRGGTTMRLQVSTDRQNHILTFLWTLNHVLSWSCTLSMLHKP